MDFRTAPILVQMQTMPAFPVRKTFTMDFEVLPAPWVSKQNKVSQHYLGVIHRLLFVRLLTNNHVKKPRLLELTSVFSAGCFAESSYMCHPLPHCVLRGPGHVLHDAQESCLQTEFKS